MSHAPAAAPVASPCNGVCRIDDADGCRIGCGRTLDEIAAWPALDETGRRALLRRLAARAVAPVTAAPQPLQE